jgi:hypothetical protein
MKRYALVRGGVTEGVILWDGVSPYTPPPGCALVEEAQAPPRAAEPPPPVPETITRSQLLLALARAGVITAAEALSAATSGAVPAAIEAVFRRLPPTEALAARITWATMTVVERQHPLVQALIAAGIAKADQVDDMFRAGANL